MHEGGLYQTIGPASVLPWVPDLVGKEWSSRKAVEAVVIVGSAYAPFIAEYTNTSSGHGLLPLRAYAEASSAAQFSADFLRTVAAGHPHYKWIQKFVERHLHVYSPRSLVLMDLCRISFVMRYPAAGQPGARKDIGGDKIVEDSGPTFTLCTSGTAGSWVFQRFARGTARRIVALGRIAELGILRAFLGAAQARDQKRMFLSALRIQDPTGTPWKPRPKHLRDDWTRKGVYAGKFGTQHWRKGFWRVSGILNGEQKKWSILPVYHRAAWGTFDLSSFPQALWNALIW